MDERAEMTSIETRLKEVEEMVINRPPPPPIVVICGEENTSIVVDEITENDTVYFVVFRIDDGPVIRVPKNKFRMVLFEDCNGMNVCIQTKLCRV